MAKWFLILLPLIFYGCADNLPSLGSCTQWEFLEQDYCGEHWYKVCNQKGRLCTYDFHCWQYAPNGCEGATTAPPGVVVPPS